MMNWAECWTLTVAVDIYAWLSLQLAHFLHCFVPDEAFFLRVHSHPQFIRRELLPELFGPCNHEKLVYNPLLNFSVEAKIDQIASVSAPAEYSTTHYLVNNPPRNSSRLINRRCE